MGWVYLLIAAFFEGSWVVMLAYSGGFKHIGTGVLAAIFGVCSFSFLTLAIRAEMPAATSYAVWVGIGFGGAVLGSTFVLKESMNAGQWVCVALVLVGVIGLRYFTPLEVVAPK